MPKRSSKRRNPGDDCLRLNVNAEQRTLFLHMLLDKDRPDRIEVVLLGITMCPLILSPQGEVVDIELVYHAAHQVAAAMEVQCNRMLAQ